MGLIDYEWVICNQSTKGQALYRDIKLSRYVGRGFGTENVKGSKTRQKREINDYTASCPGEVI